MGKKKGARAKSTKVNNSIKRHILQPGNLKANPVITKRYEKIYETNMKQLNGIDDLCTPTASPNP